MELTEGWAYYRDLFRRRWKTVAGVVLFSLVGAAACSALIISLIHRQLSGVVNTGLTLPLLYVGSIALYVVISTVSEYQLLSLAEDELRDLRVRLSRRILELPLERVEELGSSRIMALLTEDLSRVAQSIGKLTTLLLNGSLIAGVGAYLAWLSPALFVPTVVLLAIGIQIYLWPHRRLRLLQRYWERLRESFDTLLGQFEGLSRGAKELLMHRDRRHAFLEEGLSETCVEIRNDVVRSRTLQQFFFRLGEVLVYGVLGVMLFVLPRFAFIDPEVVTGYVIAGLYALIPIGSIINFGPNFAEARVSLRRLEVLGVLTPHRSPPDSVVATDTSSDRPPHLQFEGVGYEYASGLDESPFRLGPLDLELRPGEVVFLTGGNGSGKTTLFKLLCGLYVPTRGRIRVNGAEVTASNIEAYREQFSVVFNDFHLFDRFYGLEAAEVDYRAGEFLERLELEGQVTVEGGRPSTTDLSQGQRKRLALMTALLEQRWVYLFDEWAADQDPHFKTVFYTELLPELKARGHTVLAITHDDRWYETADRVLELADGRLVSREPSRQAAWT